MQAESRFIFESMKYYKFVVALGVFSVLLNVSLFVFNVFHGADINKLLCNSLSAITSAFAVIVLCLYNKLKDKLVIEYNEKCAYFKKKWHNDAIDHFNDNGCYKVFELRNAFFVSKFVDGMAIFIVRSFIFDIEDDDARKKARLRAYSLLNHITDNGKLWRVESK